MSKLEKIKRIIQGDAAAQRSLRRALPMFYFFTVPIHLWNRRRLHMHSTN